MRFIIALLLLATVAFGENALVTLAWDKSPEADVTGYELLIGTLSGNYDRTYQVAGTTQTVALPVGAMHFAVVRALNTSGLKSEPSNELAFQVYRPGEAKPPGKPTGLRRTDIAVTLQSSPDLQLWSDEATHRFAVEGDRHFWRLAISK